jgi:hypothetical protein
VEALSKNCGLPMLRSLAEDERFRGQLEAVARATGGPGKVPPSRDAAEAHDKLLELVQARFYKANWWGSSHTCGCAACRRGVKSACPCVGRTLLSMDSWKSITR